MSVILITFVGAPKVSEEAIVKVPNTLNDIPWYTLVKDLQFERFVNLAQAIEFVFVYSLYIFCSGPLLSPCHNYGYIFIFEIKKK